MSLNPPPDIPLLVTSPNTSSERRITPTWTIAHLKARLEPVTGVPAHAQRLLLRLPGSSSIGEGGSSKGEAGPGGVPIEAADEQVTTLEAWGLVRYAEILVTDTRPPSARPNYTDASTVEKYTMPTDEYAKKTDSVLAWKKAQKLGRFDPHAPSLEQAKITAFQREVESRGIAVGKRCRVGGEDSRRGTVRYVGEVKEIPGGLGAWVGVQLDEPMGKNDGEVGGRRYWGVKGGVKDGVFVRPERVEVGDWPVLDDLEDMEEI